MLYKYRKIYHALTIVLAMLFITSAFILTAKATGDSYRASDMLGQFEPTGHINYTLLGAPTFSVGQSIQGSSSNATGVVSADNGSTLSIQPIGSIAFINGETITDTLLNPIATATSDLTYTFDMSTLNWTQGVSSPNSTAAFPNDVGFNSPQTLAIDTVHHRLFVSDDNNHRVLVFNLDGNNNIPDTGTFDHVADYVLGSDNFKDITHNVNPAGTLGGDIGGLAYDGFNNRLFVSDTRSHRVLVFDVSTITNGEDALYVLGQPNFTSNVANAGAANPIAEGFDEPEGLEYNEENNILFVTELHNHRVLVFDVSTATLNAKARGFTPFDNGGLGIDASWVLGGDASYPTTHDDFTKGDNGTTGYLLKNPWDVAFEASASFPGVINGTLYVSDAGNSRVMRWNISLSTGNTVYSPGSWLPFGQADVLSGTPGVSQCKMWTPRAIEYDAIHNRLFVSDEVAGRILVYNTLATIPSFCGAIDAEAVLGQPDFFNQTAGTSDKKFSVPYGITIDASSSRLYTIDIEPHRIMIYNFIDIITASLPSGKISTAYSQPIYTSGSQGTVLFFTTNVPAGLTFVTDPMFPTQGLLSGTPIDDPVNCSGGYPCTYNMTVFGMDRFQPLPSPPTAVFRTTTHTYPITITKPSTCCSSTTPTIQITTPSNGAKVSSFVSVAAQVTPKSKTITSVSFSYTGSQNGQITDTYTVSGNDYSVNWNTVGVPDGTYTIEATAFYNGGQVSDTSSVTICNSCHQQDEVLIVETKGGIPDVSGKGAILQGALISGATLSPRVWFSYYQSANNSSCPPNGSSETVHLLWSKYGIFATSITNLLPDTDYVYCAYAEGKGQTAVGSPVLFHTAQIVPDIFHITTTHIKDTDVEKPYTQLIATESAASSGPVTFSILSGDLPEGLSLETDKNNNKYGILHGTTAEDPTCSGYPKCHYQFVIQAVDALSATDTQLYNLYVTNKGCDILPCNGGPVFILNPATLPDGMVSATYIPQTLTTQNAKGVVSFGLFSGILPPGITLDSLSGILSGVPTKEGTYHFSVRAFDTKSTVYESYAIKINTLPPPPPLPPKDEGQKCAVASLFSGSIGLGMQHLCDLTNNIYVAATAQVVAAAGLLAGLVSSLFPSHLWSLLLSFFGFRKRAPWGVVYDAATKRPLDPVYLELIDQDGKQVATAISDINGRYGFLVPPGMYMIRAKKTNYVFPSIILGHVTRDEIYDNLYFGNYFEIKKEGEVITKNIPLDPVRFDWNEFEKKEQGFATMYSRRIIWLNRIANILFAAGFILAIITFITHPTTLTIITLGLYIVLLVVKEVGISLAKLGTVVDKKTGRPIPYTIIRVYSATLSNEVIHKVANEYGQFYCLVPNGSYIVTIEKKSPEGGYVRIFTSQKIEVKKGIIKGEWKV